MEAGMTSTITDRLSAAVDGVPVQLTGTGIINLTQTSGTNDVVCSSFPVLTEWAANQIFSWRPTAANTGAMTMTIAGVAGAKDIHKPNGDSLAADDIQIGLDVLMRYDGTELRIMGSGF
jgi:hypothetical protein